MYEIRFKGSRVQKQFKRLLEKHSSDVKRRLRTALLSQPYPSPTYGRSTILSAKIEKKGPFFCYEISGGDRILYDIVEEPIKAVIIHFAGNHDGEIRFLRKNA